MSNSNNNFDYRFADKKENLFVANQLMLAKTIRMFEWEGLPDTIPHRYLEKLLQENGYAFITEIKGELYALQGGLGGVPDAYGQPTQIVIANPALNFYETLSIADDGVMILNDDVRLGISPLLHKYNFMLVENDINMVLHGYTTRMTRVISAPDDATRESAQRFVDDSIDGKLTVIGENMLFDGIRVQGGAVNTTAITQLIEYGQHVRSLMYNELGISSNNNLKRERLVTGEVEQNEASLFPFVYGMMACRNEACEKLSTKYNIEVEVNFGSIWADKYRELVDDVVDDNADALNPDVDVEGDNIASDSSTQDGEAKDEHILENNSGSTGESSNQSSESESTEGRSELSDSPTTEERDSTTARAGEGETDREVSIDVDSVVDDVNEVIKQIEETDLSQPETTSITDILTDIKEALDQPSDADSDTEGDENK